MADAMQLQYLLNQRHEEMMVRDSGRRSAPAASEKRRVVTTSKKQSRRKQTQAYVSPFVRQAAEKALKRAMANSRLLPNRAPINQAATGGGGGAGNNTSFDSIRSEDVVPKKKRSKGSGGAEWNFETKTSALFDPKMKKQEIFRPQPRIPEVRLRPSSGGGLSYGTMAAANAVAEALGLASAADEATEVDTLASSAAATAAAIAASAAAAAVPRSSMSEGAFSSRHAPPAFRGRPLTRVSFDGLTTSSGASGSGDDGSWSPSPPTSSSPPRRRSSTSGGGAGSSSQPFSQVRSPRPAARQQAPQRVTRSVSPMDERLLEAIFSSEAAGDDYALDEPVDRRFQFPTRPGALTASGGSAPDAMMSSMAQVLSAVSDLVLSIRSGGGLGRPGASTPAPWTRRRAGLATPGAATPMHTQGRASSAFQIKMAEEALQDMHRKELRTAPATGSGAQPNKGPSGQVTPPAAPAPLTRAAVVDLVLSKLHALEASERETVQLLLQPPAPPSKSSSSSSSSSSSATLPTAPSSTASGPLSSSSASRLSAAGVGVSSLAQLKVLRDATRLPRVSAAAAPSYDASGPGRHAPQGQGQGLGIISFSHHDEFLAPRASLEGLSDADAAYFHTLASEEARARSTLQLVAPRPSSTHETAITSMLNPEAGAAFSSSPGRGRRALRNAAAGAAEHSFVQGLFSPSMSDRARAADHKKHLASAMQQRRVRALAHLPTLMPSVAFVQSIEAYNKRLKIAQDMKNIPFDARGISSCYVGDRIADVVVSDVLDDVAEELEGFFEEYSLNFSSQV